MENQEMKRTEPKQEKSKVPRALADDGNDLAAENIANDLNLTAADLQDL